jgi:hypothetical protein
LVLATYSRLALDFVEVVLDASSRDAG